MKENQFQRENTYKHNSLKVTKMKYQAALFSSLLSGVFATENVILQNYVGHWYQMYADAYVVNTFERGSFCATADYRLNNDATVSLFNSQANGAADGPLSNVTGTAYTTDVAGELSVINIFLFVVYIFSCRFSFFSNTINHTFTFTL
jgi:lipocalin